MKNKIICKYLTFTQTLFLENLHSGTITLFPACLFSQKFKEGIKNGLQLALN